MPVPPQLRLMLLLELNLVKEVRDSHVHGHSREEIRILKDGIQKNVKRYLGVLNTTLRKKFSKIFGPS